MRSRPFSRVTILTTPRAATFVTDPASFRFLQPFMGRTRHPAEVATEIGVSVGAVTHRIAQMLEAGLLEHVATVPRAGRPMRAYRAVSDDLFAPMDLTPSLSLGSLMRDARLPDESQLRAAIERAWLRLSRERRWGTHAYRVRPDGPVNRDFVPVDLVATGSIWDAALADDAPAVWDQMATLRLERADAKKLQREVAAIVGRYAARSDGRGARHLVHFALAPLD